jgi:hypothetical protein
MLCRASSLAAFAVGVVMASPAWADPTTAEVGPLSPAGATDPSDSTGGPWSQRPLALIVHVGLGTPVGFVGLGAEYSFNDYLAVEAGAGINGVGPQGAAMGRLRLPIGDRALMLGAGVSAGPYRWREITFGDGRPAEKEWSVASWGNLELAAEIRGAYLFRFTTGYAVMGPATEGTCIDAQDTDFSHCQLGHQDSGESLIYMGIAFGFAP